MHTNCTVVKMALEYRAEMSTGAWQDFLFGIMHTVVQISNTAPLSCWGPILYICVPSVLCSVFSFWVPMEYMEKRWHVPLHAVICRLVCMRPYWCGNHISDGYKTKGTSLIEDNDAVDRCDFSIGCCTGSPLYITPYHTIEQPSHYTYLMFSYVMSLTSVVTGNISEPEQPDTRHPSSRHPPR